MSDDPSQRGEGGGRGKKKPVRRPESYLPEMLRSLPQSLDAEKGVLGSILLSPTTVLDECITRQVGPKYFHLPAHALIFSVLVEMQEKKKPIDLISLTQFLEDSHRLAGVGGAMAVTDLFTFVPTATNASYYLEIVREKYLLRQIIATCTEYAARAYDEQNEVPVLLNEVEKKVLSIGRDRFAGASKTIKTLALGALESVEKMYENRGALTGLATGFAFEFFQNVTSRGHSHDHAGIGDPVGVAAPVVELSFEILGERPLPPIEPLLPDLVERLRHLPKHIPRLPCGFTYHPLVFFEKMGFFCAQRRINVKGNGCHG